jgi:ABC-2 type transport system ATP-binding protein
MINIQNLSFLYGDQLVLDQLSIGFENGCIAGIVGLNGAGKTTFFNVFSHYLRPESGSMLMNENEISARDVAYLETVNYFYSRITGNEYLGIFTQSNPDFNLNGLQEYFKLPLDSLIETYSTGMKKKLALLGILKQDKPIYLLDEPFNGLDLETNKILELIICLLKEKGKTVFVSSHILEPLLSVCDSIHLLENGRFTRSYLKSEFHSIEEDLFRKLKDEAREILSKLI